MAGPTYQFLPWVRSGLAATLTHRDTLGAGVPGRARLGVEVRVSRSGSGAALPVSRELSLLGPGDVVGLDPNQVIRTDPRRGATDAEPNYLAQVEFDRPDLPWLFTPAAPAASDRLRPWLVLAVVAQGRGVNLLAAGAGAPLPVLELLTESDPGRQLPDLGDSWAWAHGQVLALPGESADGVLAGVPSRNASRLLCPRRLDPTTRYLACVVPAFEAGRRAGLGLEPEGDEDAALRPAWTTVTGAISLPVYYSWEFTTGVRWRLRVAGPGPATAAPSRGRRPPAACTSALRGRPCPPSTPRPGRRHRHRWGSGAPFGQASTGRAPGPSRAAGALVAPGSAVAAWPDATRAAVEEGLPTC